MLDLYHWEPNTFSLKVLIALNEKNIPFTSHYVDFLKFEHYALPFAGNIEVAYNPELDGPILVSDGTAMTESFFITLFLDELAPATPLRPAGAYGRWEVLSWARFLNEAVAPSVSTLGAKKYLAPALAARDRGEIEKAIAAMPTEEQRAGWRAALDDSYSDELLEDCRRKAAIGVAKIEEGLAKSDWLVGSAYSLADIDGFSLIDPLRDLAPDLLNDAPRTRSWLRKIGLRPAVKAALGAGKTGRPRQAYTPGPEHSRWG
ncbi:MAG: glutathione S-transferase family protein [Rhizomicrobium sp.]